MHHDIQADFNGEAHVSASLSVEIPVARVTVAASDAAGLVESAVVRRGPPSTEPQQLGLPLLEHHRVRLHRPSGRWLLSLAELLYSKQTFEEIFAAIIGDMRQELYDAWEQGRWFKAWLIGVRWRVAFITAVIKHGALIGLASIIEIIRRTLS